MLVLPEKMDLKKQKQKNKKKKQKKPKEPVTSFIAANIFQDIYVSYNDFNQTTYLCNATGH